MTIIILIWAISISIVSVLFFRKKKVEDELKKWADEEVTRKVAEQQRIEEEKKQKAGEVYEVLTVVPIFDSLGTKYRYFCKGSVFTIVEVNAKTSEKVHELTAQSIHLSNDTFRKLMAGHHYHAVFANDKIYYVGDFNWRLGCFKKIVC